MSNEQVVLKLHEGTRARLRNGVLSFDARRLDDEDRRRLARLGLKEEAVQADVEEANALLSKTGVSLHRLLARSEEELDRERPQLELEEGEELADLNLYFMVRLSLPDAKAAAALIDALNALASVEVAYPEPLPAAPLAVDQAPATTLDLVPSQFYTLPANLGGIDSDWAGRFPGGRGAGIRIIDVEAGWTTSHEDLPNLFSFDGWNFKDLDHGVAVLGVLGAGRNGYGATGIATDALLGASSVVYPVWHSPFSIGVAIDNAASRLSRGDVLMIEQHYPGNLPLTATCTCNCAQFGYLPAESIQAAFDVIRNATARGIVVVEAAGNGGMNLDDPLYLSLFNRNFRDSRAILVGAGNAAGGLTGCPFSNFGTRVDVQSLGGGVATLGYGPTAALRANGNDPNQFYTDSFSGTSSATPLVAGAVAAVNGTRLADGVGLLDSFFMRQWLHDTGVPQPAPVTRAIGPRIDLRAAMPRISGELESVAASGQATGFAFHSGTSASIQVTFEVDGVPAGSTTANLARADVNARFGLIGQHGFNFKIPWQFHDDRQHVLRATGQPPAGAGGTPRRLLFTRSFTLPSLRGFVDGASSHTGVVSGWAFFAPDSASSMQVYVKLAGGNAIGFFTTATARPDVNTAYGISGVHGFDVQLPSRLRGSTLTVEVYGVHPVNGIGPLLGTTTLTWLMPPLRPWPY